MSPNARTKAERWIGGIFFSLGLFVAFQQMTYFIWPRRLVAGVGSTLFDIESCGDWPLTVFLLGAVGVAWALSFAAAISVRKLAVAAMIVSLLLYSWTLFERAEQPDRWSSEIIGINGSDRGWAGSTGIYNGTRPAPEDNRTLACPTTNGRTPSWWDNDLIRQLMLDRVYLLCWVLGGAAGCLAFPMVSRASRILSDSNCQACGYSLAGLADLTCPECGTKHGPTRG